MKITFTLANTWETYLRLCHENECIPYARRTVTIDLTDEQNAMLRLHKVGTGNGDDKFERIIDCFIENDPSNEAEL